MDTIPDVIAVKQATVDLLQPLVQELQERVDGVNGGEVLWGPCQVEDVLLQVLVQLGNENIKIRNQS